MNFRFSRDESKLLIIKFAPSVYKKVNYLKKNVVWSMSSRGYVASQSIT
jgi:hypothetical protein